MAWRQRGSARPSTIRSPNEVNPNDFTSNEEEEEEEEEEEGAEEEVAVVSTASPASFFLARFLGERATAAGDCFSS